VLGRLVDEMDLVGELGGGSIKEANPLTLDLPLNFAPSMALSFNSSSLNVPLPLSDLITTVCCVVPVAVATGDEMVPLEFISFIEIEVRIGLGGCCLVDVDGDTAAVV
jgi:hypothetical protein